MVIVKLHVHVKSREIQERERERERETKTGFGMLFKLNEIHAMPTGRVLSLMIRVGSLFLIIQFVHVCTVLK